MAANKTQATAADVDAFLEGVTPEPKRSDAQWVHATMRELAGAPGRMWGPSIVGYGDYRYVYDSGREGDWFLVGFSPRKAALTVYIMPGFSNYAPLLERLGKHKVGKSCLYIKRLADVDLDVLRELIAQSIAHMGKKKTAAKKKR